MHWLKLWFVVLYWIGFMVARGLILWNSSVECHVFSFWQKKDCALMLLRTIGANAYCKTQEAVDFDGWTAPTTESSIWDVTFISHKWF